MLDYETDDDAHFECPQCGQKGAVPKATIEKALAETPHVYISCSNCAHKFEPFAPIEEAGRDAAETASQQEAAPSPLEEHWAQHDDDGEDADADEAAGHLPGWMMPAEKPQAEVKDEAQAETKDEAQAEKQSETNDVPDAPPEEDDENPTEDEKVNAGEEGSEEISEAIAAGDGLDEPQIADEPTGVDEPTAVDEPTEIDEPTIAEEPTGVDKPQPMQDIAPPPEEAPASMTMDAPQYPPIPPLETQERGGPTGIVNSLLVGLVFILLTTGAYMFFNSQATLPAGLAPANASAIDLQEADFVRFSEAGEAGIEVSINFKNPSAQMGIIGDFRIELHNEAGERLVHWTILSTGEAVAPGQSRTLTSVLFGPPAGLARVQIVYPLDE